jgi:hypothetical protein
LQNAQPDDAPAVEAARRAIAEGDRKLARHRAALEAGADPADKAEVYRELGIRLTYHHTEHTVLAETRPTSSVGVVSVSEGGLDHYAHVLHQRKLLVEG